MKPETRDYLAKAREDLADARVIAGTGLAKVAARAAYFAAFHTAEALIFERTGKVVKTHSGVRTAFAQLLRDMPKIDRSYATFLAQAYKYKEISDYGVGRSVALMMSEAETAIEKAAAFFDRIADLLEGRPSG